MTKVFLNLKPAIILFFLIAQISVSATTYPINVTFSGLQETPANNSTATGTFVGTYNDATDSLIYTVTFSGLSSNVTAAHFHGYVPPGIQGAVLFFPVNPSFPTGITAGTFVDSVKLTQGQEDSLKMGLIYFNIHTVNFGGGEIRAQLFLQDASFVLPDISCPTDINANTDPNVCTANVTFAATTTVAGTPASVIYYRIGNTAITSPRVFPQGTTTVIATAVNGAGYDSCSFKVIVKDAQPPVITCPANITQVNDPGKCGAIVNYTVTASDNCTSSVTVTVQPASGSFFQVGTTTVNAKATDGAGNTSACSFTVTVNDVEPPVIHDLTVSPRVIWPPNHKMQNVTMNYTSTDNCGVVTCQITAVSDEPENGTGDGDTGPDSEVLNDHHLKLRAERSGSGDGRVYTLKVTCTDAHGNTASETRTVLVPKSLKAKDIRDIVFADRGHGKGNSMADNVVVLKEEDPDNMTLVQVYPNPSTSYFTLNIISINDKEKISVRLIDVSGRVMEVRNNVSGNQTLRMGANLKAGFYIAQIIQGDESKQVKVLKQ